MRYVLYGYGYVTVVEEYGPDISVTMALNISGSRDRMIRILPFSFSSNIHWIFHAIPHLYLVDIPEPVHVVGFVYQRTKLLNTELFIGYG